jgi:hypothetical protein
MSHGADCQTCGMIASSSNCKCCSACNISQNPKCSCQGTKDFMDKEEIEEFDKALKGL